MTQKELVKQLVQDAATRLAEHTDSVEILVTFRSEDGDTTSSYEFGHGNFYARLGQVREWLEIQSEYAHCEARRRDADTQD